MRRRLKTSQRPQAYSLILPHHFTRCPSSIPNLPATSSYPLNLNSVHQALPQTDPLSVEAQTYRLSIDTHYQ